jgi:hypothetical protein
MLEIVLLAGKIIFLIVLYLFIYKVVRSTTRELRMAAPVAARPHWPAPGAAHAGGGGSVPGGVSPGGPEAGVWTLSVLKSPCIPVGAAYALQPGAHALAGRSSEMDIFLDDTFVSSKHALFEVAPDGLRVEDLRSTNGTQVNGTDIEGSVLLKPGDRIEVGDTVFQLEAR